MRVPASDGLSLIKAKARGADIRMVYSAADALKLAEQNPDREVVFFAIGFETTTPPTALVIRDAAARGPTNLHRRAAARLGIGHRARALADCGHGRRGLGDGVGRFDADHGAEPMGAMMLLCARSALCL